MQKTYRKQISDCLKDKYNLYVACYGLNICDKNNHPIAEYYGDRNMVIIHNELDANNIESIFNQNGVEINLVLDI